MSPLKSFIVFGERIDVLVNSATSNGASATIVQHVPAGGGPPPHSHSKEDETFTVLEGDFEVFGDGRWHPLARGEVAYGQRGGVHTFRNIGTTPGRVIIFITPAGFENYPCGLRSATTLLLRTWRRFSRSPTSTASPFTCELYGRNSPPPRLSSKQVKEKETGDNRDQCIRPR